MRSPPKRARARECLPPATHACMQSCATCLALRIFIVMKLSIECSTPAWRMLRASCSDACAGKRQSDDDGARKTRRGTPPQLPPAATLLQAALLPSSAAFPPPTHTHTHVGEADLGFHQQRVAPVKGNRRVPAHARTRQDNHTSLYPVWCQPRRPSAPTSDAARGRSTGRSRALTSRATQPTQRQHSQRDGLVHHALELAPLPQVALEEPREHVVGAQLRSTGASSTGHTR